MDQGRLDHLRAIVRSMESGAVQFGERPVSLGHAIDPHLPWQGLPGGFLHEVQGEAADAFAMALAACFLRHSQRHGGAEQGGMLLWCQDRDLEGRYGTLYGPGLGRFGIDASQLILVRSRGQELLWAVEEALRCRALSVVVGEIETLDLVTSRRLQLACEAGRNNGILLRRRADLGPNAALTRWRVTPLAERIVQPAATAWRTDLWRADLWRIKRGVPHSFEVIWNATSLSFALAAGLAGGPLDAEFGQAWQEDR